MSKLGRGSETDTGFRPWVPPVPLSDAQRNWQLRNLTRINGYIRGLSQHPDDTLFSALWEGHFVVVTKGDGLVRLWLIDEANNNTRWYQSELDLDRPLRPSFGYLRGMLLALLWQPSPKRLFFGGLGGGVLPTVLHHYFPAAQFDCIEIAAPVIEAARGYFPLPQDQRMHVWHGDALEFLQQQDSRQPFPDHTYDLLFLDIFLDQGRSPDYMTAQPFFTASKARMAPGAVLGLNLHAPPDDPRRALLTSLFATVVDVPIKKNHSLLLATDGPRLSFFQRMERFLQIHQAYRFEFSVGPWIETLTYLDG